MSSSWNDFRTNGHSFSQPESKTMTKGLSKRWHYNIILSFNNLKIFSMEQKLPFAFSNGRKIATKSLSLAGLLWR